MVYKGYLLSLGQRRGPVGGRGVLPSGALGFKVDSGTLDVTGVF